jgi:transposase
MSNNKSFKKSQIPRKPAKARTQSMFKTTLSMPINIIKKLRTPITRKPVMERTSSMFKTRPKTLRRNAVMFKTKSEGDIEIAAARSVLKIYDRELIVLKA